MTDYKIQAVRTARYSILEPSEIKPTAKVWLVFHGYGQLAKYFIRKFQALVDLGDIVVAVEGLSRAYINGFTGRVGASWMTKEDRLDEIEDYLAYIDSVYENILERFGKRELIVLGFSQGSATASRWALTQKDSIDQLLLWCGEPAKELQDNPSLELLNVHLFLGENDAFFNEKSLNEAVWIKNIQQKKDHFHVFKGGHDIDSLTLVKFRRMMI